MNIIKKKIFREINSLNNNLTQLSKNDLIPFQSLCAEAIKTIKNNKKIILFGNGGSAADAQHLATELTVKYQKVRKPIAAISLATDTSALTAIGNDFNFDKIFSRQIEALAQKGDLVLGITTSGMSPNIIEAFKIANKMKVKNYCFTGNKGGKIKNYCKNCIIFPKTSTSQTQVMQIFLGQIFCEILEEKLF